MQVLLRSNIKGVTKNLGTLEKKYVPNAIRKVINETLFGLKKAHPEEIKSVFEEPVSFTTHQSAWFVGKAKKTSLSGLIKLKQAQASYLRLQVCGGTAQPKRRTIPVPRPVQRVHHGGLKKIWKNLLD